MGRRNRIFLSKFLLPSVKTWANLKRRISIIIVEKIGSQLELFKNIENTAKRMQRTGYY